MVPEAKSLSDPLTRRNWDSVRNQIRSADALPLAVLDEFLKPSVATSLRTLLLREEDWIIEDWGDEHREHASNYLHLPRPQNSTVREVVSEIASALRTGLQLPSTHRIVSYWAILCASDAGIPAHADNAAFVANLWLTPDRHNLNPSSGGMVFYPRMRPMDMPYPDFVIQDKVEAFIGKDLVNTTEIGYGYNRAVVFDGRLFHASSQVRFDTSSRRTMRLNLSVALDDPVAWRKRTKGSQSSEEVDI